MSWEPIDLVTLHICQPITERHYDWCAYIKGHEEYAGYGPSEEEAIADLKTNIEGKAHTSAPPHSEQGEER